MCNGRKTGEKGNFGVHTSRHQEEKGEILYPTPSHPLLLSFASLFLTNLELE